MKTIGIEYANYQDKFASDRAKNVIHSKQLEATHGKTYEERAFRRYPEVYTGSVRNKRAWKGTF